MFRALRPRSVYDVLAVIGCLAALTTGAAYAANTIRGSDVVDESLTGVDVRGTNGTDAVPGVNGTLKTADIAGQPEIAASGQPYVNGTLTTWDLADNNTFGRDIRDDSLTGADIRESSLAIVPNADTLDGKDSTDFLGAGAKAADADTLDGKDSKEFARLGGVVYGDGTVSQGSGFQVAYLDAGEYRISFPEGTLSSGMCPPVAVVTPFSGLVRHPQIAGRSCNGLGAGSFTVKLLDADGVARDTPFLFIAM
jgi:hypothetical protein